MAARKQREINFCFTIINDYCPPTFNHGNILTGDMMHTECSHPASCFLNKKTIKDLKKKKKKKYTPPIKGIDKHEGVLGDTITDLKTEMQACSRLKTLQREMMV